MLKKNILIILLIVHSTISVNGGKEHARISLDPGWRFYKIKDHDKALSYFEKGISARECTEQIECLFLKGEVLFNQGNTGPGQDLMMRAMERGLSSKKWYQKRYIKLKKGSANMLYPK